LTGSRFVLVDGETFERADFVRALAQKDQAAARRLVAQLKQDRNDGSSGALSLVSEAFAGRLLSYLRGSFGGNESLATEVLNETLERVFTRIDAYSAERSAFRTWIFEQAKYAALDYRRREHQQGAVSSAEAIAALEGLDEPPEEPLTPAESRALQRAFRGLTPTQRNLMWLRYVEGKSPTEISRSGVVPGIPEEHVRVYINRAALKLAKRYREELRSALVS
jgi:RNA polymerase sigma factor (sigma-70 family)